MPASRSGSKKSGTATRPKPSKGVSPKRMRFVKGSKPAGTRRRTSSQNGSIRRAPQRKSVQKSREKATIPSSKTERTKTSRTSASFTPGWKDLKKSENSRHLDVSGAESILGAISTVRFSLAVLAIAGMITLYVGHVHATQNLLVEVQEMRRENLSLHLGFNRVKGMYDRSTGPSVIYERASLLGLEERMVTGMPILVSR